MKYFTNCKTLDELKAEYRRLAMANHPELDHVYIVQDEPIIGTGDYFEKAFRTLEEANDDAREQLHYLTERERKQRHIWVFRVDREDLDPSIANEDLPIDWKAYSCSGSTDGCFDSAEGK